tara:strand:- start:814 stop:1608 length:795 start_codon:yes stop_codon:yes gene_type:complete
VALTNPYIIALRAGNIGLATALLNPQTTQSYSENTMNTKQFLTDEGYDISKPESIPNSAFYSSSGKSAARIAAEERTLQLALQKQAQQKAETGRMARLNSMNSVSENSNNLPHYDAQNQRSNNNISNNNVNPAALFTPQPVNSNANSQNSSVGGGINVNANYNYATQMNDFQTANPTGQVNMGQAPQGWGYTGGKSSIPFENEVKTSLLGGDIQHQESEINTNVGYLPEMNDPQDTIGFSFSQVGSVGIAVAGIGALLLMGKIK